MHCEHPPYRIYASLHGLEASTLHAICIVSGIKTTRLVEGVHVYEIVNICPIECVYLLALSASDLYYVCFRMP